MYLHLPIPTLVLRKFAKSKIKPYCQEVKASRDWLQKFSQSHELALQRSTLISQELPKHLEEKLPGFYMMCANFLKTGKYPLALVRTCMKRQFSSIWYPINLLQRKAVNWLL